MSKNYFQLLGQPLENSDVQALIRDYQLQDEFKDFNKNLEKSWREDGSFTEQELENMRAQGRFDAPNHQAIFSYINANTESYQRLRIYLSRKPKLTNPLTVDTIVFHGDFSGGLPLGITQNIDYETVSFGTKISFEKNPYGGFVKVFLVDSHKLTLFFDDDKQLESITLSLLDAHEALLIQFKKDLNAQKPHINPNFSAQNLHLSSPVMAWRKRQADGDDLFTDANLSASQQILDVFLTKVSGAATKKSPAQLLAAIKNVVKALNKLTKKMANFIETNEREELVPYIHHVVKTAGLQLPDNLDLTLEWRDW